MMRFLPWLVAFLLLGAAGVVHDWRTDRWSLSDEPAASAAKLDGLPLTLGAWQGEEEKMDDEQVALAEIAGYKLRTYRHSSSGRVARVMIACGRPGPLSVHTPDICMGGAGFTTSGDQSYEVKFNGNLPAAVMKVGRFTRDAGPAGTVEHHILWAWSADGNWSTPENPRLTFARCPALFKLYVTIESARPGEPLDKNDPRLELIPLLLNNLHDRLAPAS
jgi:hypothetical protein